MVDYLIRCDLVKPSSTGPHGRGRGKRRRFSVPDVVLLRTYAYLLEKGVSVKRIKKAYQTWSRHFGAEKEASFSEKYLLCDGAKIWIKNRDEVLMDLTDGGQTVFSFVANVDAIAAEVNAKLDKIGRRTA